MVSICTLSARRWSFLETALSLSNQTFKQPIEWLIVDFLFDENQEQVADLRKLYGLDITHIRNVKDTGVPPYMKDIARNRNLALRKSKYDTIIFLDDYSLIGLDFVEQHYKCTRKGLLSCGMMYELKQDGTKIGDHRYELLNQPKGATPVLGPEWTYTGNLAFPKAFAYKLGGFDPRLSSRGEDGDFGIRAKSLGLPIVFNPDAWSINLETKGIPFHLSFDHTHPTDELHANDKEVITNAILQAQYGVHVEKRYGVDTAVCNKCGAEYILDAATFIYEKQMALDFVVPFQLSGI